ncbi:MAG: DsbA family oxidoreductase [Paludibacteraceae bacterium]
MKVEIWSDVACPFCYIGKRHFEKALSEFADRDKVEIEWKSYLLDPDYVYKPENPESEAVYIANRKGISMDEALRMFTSVTQMASKAGLKYDFEKMIVANTFNAHKIIQLAKSKTLGSEAEERFFKAFFVDGENLNEEETLVRLGVEIGLTAEDVSNALTADTYAFEVNKDIREARQIGVSGVPFFVFDRKYAVSGAQAVEVFLQSLEKSYNEWATKNNIKPLNNIAEGNVCDTDGNCT